MIRVKCRGYDGELVGISANLTEDITGHTVFVTYDVEIKIRPSENVTISEVPPVEIDVTK